MTYGFGGLLLSVPGIVDWRQGWIWTKLALVLLLTVFHVKLARWRLDFAAGKFTHTSRFYRMVNEIPTIADDRDRAARRPEAVLNAAALQSRCG